jgi:hypothetical protein
MKIIDRVLDVFRITGQAVTMTKLERLNYDLKQSEICKPMHELKESKLDNDGQKVKIWLNPHNQHCFNFGYYTYEDFYQWLLAKGPIVKGSTDEEKQKYFDLALFEAKYDYGWGIGYNMKYFDLIDETYYAKSTSGYGNCRWVEKPLKITKTNHQEIISKVFGSICKYYKDLEINYTSNARQKMDDEMQGAKEVLHALGVGYFGAVNLPEEVENLSWLAEICTYKTVYLHLLQEGVVMPDFRFVYAERWKQKDRDY